MKKNKINYLKVIICVIIFFSPLLILLTVYPKNIVKMGKSDYIINNDLIYSVEEITMEHGKLKFDGWVVFPGKAQGYAVLDNKSIWLYNENDATFYKLKSNISSKRDSSINNIIGDGKDYQTAFFSTDCNINDLIEKNSKYQIYICYQTDDKNYLVKTQYYIKNKEIIES